MDFSYKVPGILLLIDNCVCNSPPRHNAIAFRVLKDTHSLNDCEIPLGRGTPSHKLYMQAIQACTSPKGAWSYGF